MTINIRRWNHDGIKPALQTVKTVETQVDAVKDLRIEACHYARQDCRVKKLVFKRCWYEGVPGEPTLAYAYDDKTQLWSYHLHGDGNA